MGKAIGGNGQVSLAGPKVWALAWLCPRAVIESQNGTITAYFLGGKKILKVSLADALRDDTML